MDRLYRDALQQESVDPIGQPAVEVTEMEPLAFRVTVPIYPEIDPGDYSAVRVEPVDAAVSDEDRDDTIERLRRNASEWTDVSDGRTPREGDQVTVDLTVTENGEEFQEPVEDARFVLGESNIFDGLREQLETMHVGERKDFDLTFGEDDESVSPAIRGKTLHYDVTLKAVREQQLVPLDDEFAKKTGNAETVDELRESVANDLHREKTANARTTVVNDALNKIADQASIDLPPVMIDEALDDEIKQLRLRLSQSGETLESYLRANGQTEAEMRDEMRDDAARRLRNTLVIQEIARRENINVTAEDIQNEIEMVAGASEQGEAIRNLYQQPQFLNMLRGDLFERRLTDRLIDIVTEGRAPPSTAGNHRPRRRPRRAPRRQRPTARIRPRQMPARMPLRRRMRIRRPRTRRPARIPVPTTTSRPGARVGKRTMPRRTASAIRRRKEVGARIVSNDS